ncbi:hypothetical protein ACTHSZ_12205 [Neisseria sp. P0006.S006]
MLQTHPAATGFPDWDGGRFPKAICFSDGLGKPATVTTHLLRKTLSSNFWPSENK